MKGLIAAAGRKPRLRNLGNDLLPRQLPTHSEQTRRDEPFNANAFAGPHHVEPRALCLLHPFYEPGDRATQ
jgi:hypothetical protein